MFGATIYSYLTEIAMSGRNRIWQCKHLTFVSRVIDIAIEINQFPVDHFLFGLIWSTFEYFTGLRRGPPEFESCP